MSSKYDRHSNLNSQHNWVDMDLRKDTKNICVFNRGWSMCSRYVNYNRHNRPMRPYNDEHEHLHFDTGSANHEANGCGRG